MWCWAAFYVVYPFQFLMAVIYARGGSGTNINCIYIQQVSDLILLPVKSTVETRKGIIGWQPFLNSFTS
jgi:hypothetical protein